MVKRVLILASVASMVEQFNIPNIKLLVEMGYKIHVACNFEEGSTNSQEDINNLKNLLTKMNVEYYQIDFKRNILKIHDNIKAYRQVLKLLKDFEFSFVHCHSPIGGVCGRLAGKATNTNVIYTAHGFHFYEGASPFNWLIYYPIEKWLSKYTDVLITINEEDYMRAKKFKANSIEYIPGVGLDIEEASKVIVNKTLKRKEINIPENAFLILSSGELNKNKNHEVIIRALAKVKNNEIYYVICGQGKLSKKLRDLSLELGIGDQVKLLGFRKDVAELNKVSDLFVFPSYREGLSLALMEAMAAGLPIICSNIRGNTDLIENGKGGYLVKPNDVDEISIAINKIYKNSDVRNRLSETNLKKIKKYSIHNVMKQMKIIYMLK